MFLPRRVFKTEVFDTNDCTSGINSEQLVEDT